MQAVINSNNNIMINLGYRIVKKRLFFTLFKNLNFNKLVEKYGKFSQTYFLAV